MKQTRRKVIYEVTNLTTGSKYDTTIQELMDTHSISRNTVYYWIRKGILCGDTNLSLYKKPNQTYNTTLTNKPTAIPEQTHNIGEQWIDVKGYESLYQISNFGNVFSKVSHRLLKPTLNAQGYLQVSFSKDNVNTVHAIHRLVATHFVDTSGKRLRVIHLDSNRMNNQASNLLCKPIKKLVAYNIETNISYTYPSVSACSKDLDIRYASILRCLRDEIDRVELFTFYYA